MSTRYRVHCGHMLVKCRCRRHRDDSCRPLARILPSIEGQATPEATPNRPPTVDRKPGQTRPVSAPRRPKIGTEPSPDVAAGSSREPALGRPQTAPNSAPSRPKPPANRPQTVPRQQCHWVGIAPVVCEHNSGVVPIQSRGKLSPERQSCRGA